MRGMPLSLPQFIEPAKLRPGEAFDSEDYFFELKWDGMRALAFVDGWYRLLSRNPADVSV